MPKKKTPPKVEEEVSASNPVFDSISGILLMCGGIVALLCLFGIAGTAGDAVDGFFTGILGITRVLLPLLLLVIGADMLMRDKELVHIRFFFSLALCVFGLSGILNILFARSGDAQDLEHAGGFLGLFFSSFIAGAFGPIASAIMAVAALIIGAVLLANKPLKVFLLPMLSSLKRSEKHGDSSEVSDDHVESIDSDEEGDSEEHEDSQEEDPEPPRKRIPVAAAKVVAPEESLLTSNAPHRTISVPIDLLEHKKSEANAGDTDAAQEIIVKTLKQFDIDVEMSDLRVGPTVTQYAFRPASGVKLARIVALQNDLALALAAHPIRIEAPIPGKALVGIEVPNHVTAKVSLREILESGEFAKRKSSFAVPLGRDISGGVPLLNVDKAPHMLVAGSTGSGKSVCLNGLIISLLYQNGPDDLKLIMVDPKRVELGVYAGIPHLLVPPIIKAEEAVNALKWAVREMERRLDHLAKFGARDIDAYNAKSADKMPRIIIVIDELADLMIQNKREVESTIVRIAQMARAAGIHLVLATQRPSVDVITGTIKANIPTRLAFAVASQVDSKTILDISGAEKLLGKGDMLMSTPDLSKPRRVQGAFVSDGEIERVVEFLKKESTPEYNYTILENSRSGGDGGGVALNGEDSDPLLEECIRVSLEAGRVSTSYLQRRLKIGYGRAARILDTMEDMGLVGPAEGSKPREVLVTSWPPEDETASSQSDSIDGGDGLENAEYEETIEEDEEKS
jgi:S-DNA-T family DNA segregation ATPase FtsK/SpoIIIE